MSLRPAGYDRVPKRRRQLTPMESELRAQAVAPAIPRRGGEREYRIRSSFSYVLMGLVLIGVAVALETF